MDGGASWTPQRGLTTSDLEAVDFVDDKHGWAVGERGTVVKTTDGGVTWELLETRTSSRLEAVNFVDRKTGWAVGEGGTIIFTGNGGKRWEEEESGTDADLHYLKVIDDKNAFTAGDAGSVLGFQKVVGTKASFTFFGILMAVALVMALLFRGRRKVVPDPNRNRYQPRRLSAEAYIKRWQTSRPDAGAADEKAPTRP